MNDRVAHNKEIQVLEKPKTQKVHSILHLQKALREELYEACDFWIHQAEIHGATQREISWVLRNPLWHVEEDSSRN